MVFDISLPQIALVFVVGAATLGPRDLPRAARSVGFVVGRAARYLKEGASTATRVMQEAEIPELKQEIRQSMKDMENIRTQIQTATRINVMESFNPTSSQHPTTSTSSASAREERSTGRNTPPTSSTSPSTSGSSEFLSGGREMKGASNSSSSSKVSQGRSSGKGEMNPWERELELQLRQVDATQPQHNANSETRTELLPSGADLVLECLRQQKFNRDVRETFREKMMSAPQQPIQRNSKEDHAKEEEAKDP
jgi:Sec-independent protein translocase protein TatA